MDAGRLMPTLEDRAKHLVIQNTDDRGACAHSLTAISG